MKPDLRLWTMILVLSASGIGLRLLSHGEAVPIEQPLSTLPLSLGTWQGRDVPLEPKQIKAAGVDDYLSRIYVGPGQAAVLLYVGYYRSQRTGQWVHSPKNCLPGAGWEPVVSGRVNVPVSDLSSVPVNQYIIENGLQREYVLYWYQAHGRVIASEYWGKIYLVLDALRLNRTDTSLVRITLPITGAHDAANERATLAFAQDLIARLRTVLPK